MCTYIYVFVCVHVCVYTCVCVYICRTQASCTQPSAYSLAFCSIIWSPQLQPFPLAIAISPVLTAITCC